MGIRRRIAALLILAGPSLLAQAAEKTSPDRPSQSPHFIECPDSPVTGRRPPEMECAILVRQTIDHLSAGPLVWRLETFPSIDEARKAEGESSVVVEADGMVWLMSLAKPGEKSVGGSFVAEVGPLPVPAAPKYEFLLAEAHAGSNGMNHPHTHSGPEAWYVWAGKQCVETPEGAKTAAAKEGMFEPADTPMRLTIVGPEIRDAFFIVIHDPARPWNAASDWKPKDLCAAQP